jgi:indole-3-glycerol phosphate synthase/phosphoribosylanthranilate isomerase
MPPAARRRSRCSPRSATSRAARRISRRFAPPSTPLPRKDFIVDPYQVAEARAWGAMRSCSSSRRSTTRRYATCMPPLDLGLDVLVEAHTAEEVDRAAAVGATLIGINNRDLRTFVTTLETAERLHSRLPAGAVGVAESGIESAARRTCARPATTCPGRRVAHAPARSRRRARRCSARCGMIRENLRRHRIADALHAARAAPTRSGSTSTSAARATCRWTPRQRSAALPAEVCKVGVFVDASRDEIAAIADRVGLDAIQFHGAEARALCEGWRRKRSRPWRGWAAGARRGRRLSGGLPACRRVRRRPAGGTGQRVPLEWLAGVPSERLILAGGLTPDTVADVVRLAHPAAVDVASGVESAPGIKDPEKVTRFIANARTA